MLSNIFINTNLFADEKNIKPTRNATMNPKKENQNTENHNECYIGSSLFLFGNLVPGDFPKYFQLNLGYQLSPKDIIFTEAITWDYYEPLGTYDNSDEKYPGKVRALGIGLGYQRYHWMNLFTSIQATPFLLQYFDSDENMIQEGFQLYLQLRLGYRFEFFNNRWFLEPSVAFNYWPVNTNFPTSFKEIESDAPNYYLFEPGLHFGFKF